MVSFLLFSLAIGLHLWTFKSLGNIGFSTKPRKKLKTFAEGPFQPPSLPRNSTFSPCDSPWKSIHILSYSGGPINPQVPQHPKRVAAKNVLKRETTFIRPKNKTVATKVFVFLFL